MEVDESGQDMEVSSSTTRSESNDTQGVGNDPTGDDIKASKSMKLWSPSQPFTQWHTYAVTDNNIFTSASINHPYGSKYLSGTNYFCKVLTWSWPMMANYIPLYAAEPDTVGDNKAIFRAHSLEIRFSNLKIYKKITATVGETSVYKWIIHPQGKVIMFTDIMKHITSPSTSASSAFVRTTTADSDTAASDTTTAWAPFVMYSEPAPGNLQESYAKQMESQIWQPGDRPLYFKYTPVDIAYTRNNSSPNGLPWANCLSTNINYNKTLETFGKNPKNMNPKWNLNEVHPQRYMTVMAERSEDALDKAADLAIEFLIERRLVYSKFVCPVSQNPEGYWDLNSTDHRTNVNSDCGYFWPSSDVRLESNRPKGQHYVGEWDGTPTS